MALAMFQDANGKTSGTSVSKVVIVLCVMIVWTLVSWHSKEIADIPENVLWLVGISLGAGVANKVADLVKKQ